MPYLIASLLAVSPACRADQASIAAEARAAGQAAQAAIGGQLSTAPAAEATPNYTSNPTETTLTSSDAQQQAIAARRSACTAHPENPDCAAITNAGQSVTTIATSPSMANDPAVVDALAATRNPVLDGIAGQYSDCAVKTNATGVVTTDIQSCYDYYLRALDLPCTKVREVSVTWSCPYPATGPHDDGTAYTCDEERSRTTNTCPADHPMMSGVPAYACELGWTSGCWCSNADGDKIPATQVTTPYTVTYGATPEVTESWTPDCSGYEARVPPGLLKPDGDNTVPIGGNASGRLDKCERVSSQCTDPWVALGANIPATTRIINRLAVTRSCWAFTNTFNCVNLDPRSDCNQPRFGQCTFKQQSCIDRDQFDPSFCTAIRSDFECVTSDTRRNEQVVDCSGQTYTDREGNVWDVGHPGNTDFGQVVAFMEAGREAGKYNKDGLEIFKGFDNRCRKKLFGLVNCCNKSGGPAGLLNNLTLAMSVGNLATSPFVFDGLFGSDDPDFVKRGLKGLFTGFDFSPQSVISALTPSYWTMATLALQLSGIASCDQREKDLAMKRDARLCVALGSYCSRRLPIIRTCIERTESYCCFNSILAKLINVQGKQQLGRTLGSAENPNCGGFSVAELQRLNLAAMDLSEFIDTIRPTPVANAVNPAANCPADGGGQCARGP